MVRAIVCFARSSLFPDFRERQPTVTGSISLAGYLTPIAFKAAADPNQFPEHFQEGLRPWQAKKLYVGQGFAAKCAERAEL
jgi:hypothetical protein